MFEKIKNYCETKTGFVCLGVMWFFLAVVFPIMVINSKYRIFAKTADGDIKFYGWAVVALLIAFIGIRALCTYIVEAFSKKYRTWVKYLKGFMNIILPLIMFYLACDVAADNIDRIKYCLSFIILLETAAVIINPFPKWVFNRQVADNIAVYGGKL